MPPQIITLDGKEYVVLPKAEYDLLVTLAKVAQLMPPLPPPDANGNVPAVAYARAGLARKIISSRCNLGWSQQMLADASGVHIETIRRVESGQHTPSVPTIERIDRALTAAEAKQQRIIERQRSVAARVAEILADVQVRMAEQGLTHQELADRCGWNEPQVAAYLSGRKEPGLRNLVKVASALGRVWRLTPPSV